MGDSRAVSVIWLLIVILVSLTATVAQAAGVRRITVPEDAAGSKINLMVWTPCSAAAGNIEIGGPLPLKGVLDCPIEGGKLPLVIISHGLGGAYLSHHDTAETLADGGFVVVALNHPLDSGAEGMKQAGDIAAMTSRPGDVKRVIDYVVRSSPVANKIDRDRVGFFGFSRGGYTGLVLAGAEPNFSQALRTCPDTVRMCAQVHKNEIPVVPPGKDERIRAFVIADPLTAFPDRKSLENVKAPVLLWSSALGGQGVEPSDVAAVASRLGRRAEYRPVPNSTHLSFLFHCTPEIAKLDKEACTDPPGFDRTAFHRDFDAAIVAFFRKHLRDR
jgi:predicted dienelactone hydrolase